MDECLLQQYPEIEKSHFWWVSRRTLIRRLLEDEGLGESPTVLDVGCGSGMLARELTAAGARMSGVDVASHPDWKGDGAAPRFQEGDYLSLAPTLGTFDALLALDVMEHIENERAFAAALTTNVRPGGLVIVTVPAYQWMWSGHDEINQHFRRYTRKRLQAALERGGLDVKRCGYIFFGLIGPKILAKGGEKFRDSDGVAMPSGYLNGTALAYFRWEHRLAARFQDFLPAGTSVIAVCRRRA